jgi:hypothetical protein
MRITKRILLSMMALAATVAGVAAAQSDSTTLSKVPAYRRRLIGIYDDKSGDPVAGVRVLDVLSGTSMVTSKTGTAVLIFVPEGVRILRVQKVGYEVQTFPLSIIESDTGSLTLTMHRVVELPAMVTKADSSPEVSGPVSRRMQAFEARRTSHNGGFFVTEATLRRGNGKALASVLTAQVPGLALDRRSGNKTMVVQSPRCMDGTKSGPPAVYIDGVAFTEDMAEVGRMRRAGNFSLPPVDIQRFSVEDLAGVEWYPDNSLLPPDVPHDGSRCGALLLWTRDR